MFIEELRGRRIGYLPGSTGYYALLKTLSRSGITKKDVTLVPMERTALAEALVNKKIFAFSTAEPVVSITLQDYPNTVVIHRTMTFGYINFPKEFYIRHPEAVRQVVAAEIRAVKWIKAGRENLFLAATWTHANIHSLEGGKIKIAPEQIADISIKDLIWHSEVPVIPEKSLKKDGTIASIAEFLKSTGEIDPAVSIDKIIGSFDRQLVYDILSMPDKYSLNEFRYDLKAER
jgi:ABC-type taurine transport system substrate-binding protein